MILGWSQQGASLALPPRAHLLAFLAVAVEVLARSLKIRWSARAAGIRFPFRTALRTSLGGDFGAAITPARSGAEPARFFVLAESGLPSSSVLVILYAELFLEVFSLAAVVRVVAIVFRGAGAAVVTLVGLVGTYAAVILGIGALALFLSRRNTHGPPPPWARRLRLHAGRWRTMQRALRKLRATIESVEKVNPSRRGGRLPRVGRARGHPALRAAGARVDERRHPCRSRRSRSGHSAFSTAPRWSRHPAAAAPSRWPSAPRSATRFPPTLFAAALLWWRFYTFYIYILLGALAAGQTVLRAVRKTEEYEVEVVAG